MKKVFRAKMWAKRAKIRPETRFFTIFSSLVYWFSLRLHAMIALKQCIISSRGKTHQRNLGQNRPKSGPKLVSFSILSSFLH